VVYVALQRYHVRGLVSGALKGPDRGPQRAGPGALKGRPGLSRADRGSQGPTGDLKG
jgi:hypothetical protein